MALRIRDKQNDTVKRQSRLNASRDEKQRANWLFMQMSDGWVDRWMNGYGTVLSRKMRAKQG